MVGAEELEIPIKNWECYMQTKPKQEANSLTKLETRH